MDSFDTMGMPYLASPLSLANIQGADYLSSIPGIDMPDHRSNFDAETFVRCVHIPRNRPRHLRKRSLTCLAAATISLSHRAICQH